MKNHYVHFDTPTKPKILKINQLLMKILKILNFDIYKMKLKNLNNT